MISDQKICEVFESVAYRENNGKMELIPIELRNDDNLRKAKDCVRLQKASDIVWFGKYWTGVEREGKMLFIVPVEDWQGQYTDGIHIKKRGNKPNG